MPFSKVCALPSVKLWKYKKLYLSSKLHFYQMPSKVQKHDCLTWVCRTLNEVISIWSQIGLKMPCDKSVRLSDLWLHESYLWASRVGGMKLWKQRWIWEKPWSQRTKVGIMKDNAAQSHNQKPCGTTDFFTAQVKSSPVTLPFYGRGQNVRPPTWAPKQQHNYKIREPCWA